MIDWTVLREALEALGVIGVLGFILVCFLKGLLWPKAMVDRTIEAQHKAAEKSATIIAGEVKDGMRNAVKEGISVGLAEGYVKMQKINDGEDIEA